MAHKTAGSPLVALSAMILTVALFAGTGCTKKSASEKAGTDNTQNAAASTSTPGTATSGTVAPSASDQTAAEASLITTADVPSGFIAVEAPSSGWTSAMLGVPACSPFEKAIKDADDQHTARAEADFMNPAEDKIHNEVKVHATTQIAADAAMTMAEPGFPACLEGASRKQLESSLPSDTSITSLTVENLTVQSTSDLRVDTAVAYVISLTVIKDDATSLSTTGFVALTSGRALSQLTAETSTSVDLPSVVCAAAARLKANATG